jgi:hypothetical protein
MKRENLAGRGGSGNGKVGFVFADVWLAARYTSPYKVALHLFLFISKSNLKDVEMSPDFVNF